MRIDASSLVYRFLYITMNRLRQNTIQITTDGVSLEGCLTVPNHPVGLVLFATGTADCQHASLETAVATRLHRFGFATLVMDLLSAEESSDRSNRLDIDLLTHRLELQSDWVQDEVGVAGLDTMLCGIGTGAAAAVDYLDTHPYGVAAAGLLNGRIDLARADPPDIDCPILFFVDESSSHLVDCNRTAYNSASTTSRHKHFLHAVNRDAISIVARWMRMETSEDQPPSRVKTRENRRHGV